MLTVELDQSVAPKLIDFRFRALANTDFNVSMVALSVDVRTAGVGSEAVVVWQASMKKAAIIGNRFVSCVKDKRIIDRLLAWWRQGNYLLWSRTDHFVHSKRQLYWAR